MNKCFHMDNELFDIWADNLIDKAYDWKQIGISNEYCNQISETEFGLRLINWVESTFEVVDEYKYVVFLLKYQ